MASIKISGLDLVSGSGKEQRQSLRECVEREVKFLFVGEIASLRKKLSRVQPLLIEQHYLKSGVTDLCAWALGKACLLENPPEGFVPSRGRIRRITEPNGSLSFLIQLKGKIPEHLVYSELPPNEDSQVRIELSTPIPEDLFASLLSTCVNGTLIKKRYAIPEEKLGITVEIDEMLAAGRNHLIRANSIGFFTADVEYTSQAQHALLVENHSIEILQSFMPLDAKKELRKALKNTTIAVNGTEKLCALFNRSKVPYWRSDYIRLP
jgi:hypothetical protein